MKLAVFLNFLVSKTLLSLSQQRKPSYILNLKRPGASQTATSCRRDDKVMHDKVMHDKMSIKSYLLGQNNENVHEKRQNISRLSKLW